MNKPEAPLFRDPIFDGASDPTLIWNRQEKEWWMVYTQRRATSRGPGFVGVHGSDLGVASSPDGHRWLYRGTLLGLKFEPGRNTWWAPEIIYESGIYHMYVSYVRGMPTDWKRPRHILHYTSEDLWNWKMCQTLDLSSEKVIDSCVVRLPSGGWRMWYKDEADNSFCHYSDSDDLYKWRHMGRALDYASHEGANVFFLKDCWWYIGDFWKGLGVFRSSDLLSWEFNSYILDTPGNREDDNALGHHADVLVQGEEAYIFYFTHPHDDSFTAIQTARLTANGGVLSCNRDEEFDFLLKAPE